MGSKASRVIERKDCVDIAVRFPGGGRAVYTVWTAMCDEAGLKDSINQIFRSLDQPELSHDELASLSFNPGVESNIKTLNRDMDTINQCVENLTEKVIIDRYIFACLLFTVFVLMWPVSLYLARLFSDI